MTENGKVRVLKEVPGRQTGESYYIGSDGSVWKTTNPIEAKQDGTGDRHGSTDGNYIYPKP